jgi:hypothetical protein
VFRERIARYAYLLDPFSRRNAPVGRIGFGTRWQGNKASPAISDGTTVTRKQPRPHAGDYTIPVKGITAESYYLDGVMTSTTFFKKS